MSPLDPVTELGSAYANTTRPGRVSTERPATTASTAPKVNRYEGRILDVRAMLAQPDEPIPWRCEDLAADGFLTVIAGKGGEGKSWLALALACGVAAGKSAAGIPCTQGRAVIFDAENGAKLIARRFRAAGVSSDTDVQPVDAGGLRVTREEDLAWFRAVIERHQANLVVFDSLRVLSSGSKESDGDEMEPIITALKLLARDTGAAIILIHHRGRAESSEYRGSSVILDQTDLLFMLGRVGGDPEGRHRRKLTTVKCRIEEEPEPRWVRIEADRAHGLVYVNEAEPYEEDGDGRRRDDLRDQVLEVLAGGRRSRAAVAKALGRDKSDGTIRRVLEDLESDGLADHSVDGWGVANLTTLGVGHPGHPPKTALASQIRGWPALWPPTTLATPQATPQTRARRRLTSAARGGSARARTRSAWCASRPLRGSSRCGLVSDG